MSSVMQMTIGLVMYNVEVESQTWNVARYIIQKLIKHIRRKNHKKVLCNSKKTCNEVGLHSIFIAFSISNKMLVKQVKINSVYFTKPKKIQRMYSRLPIYVFVLFFISCSGEASTPNEAEILNINKGKLYKIELKKEIIFRDNNDILIGRLGAIQIDKSDRIYMADTRRNVIEVFESDATHVGPISQRGDGPGEFRSVGHMRLFDDKLYVLDTNRQFINIFSTESLGFERTINLDPAIWRNVESINGARVTDFYIQNSNKILLEFSKLNSAEDRQLIYHLLYDGNQLENEPLIELKDAPIFADRSTGVAISMLLDFERRSLMAQGQNLNIYTAWTDEFKIDRYFPDGSLDYSLHTQFENIELSRSEFIDSYSNDTARDALQNANFPKDWPALKHLLIDDNNRLWVSTIVEDFDVYEWWVLEESGELITTFEWPREEPIEIIKNGMMYTRQTDEETGLQQVVRYRIEME
jgi:hypothetical protein